MLVDALTLELESFERGFEDHGVAKLACAWHVVSGSPFRYSKLYRLAVWGVKSAREQTPKFEHPVNAY